MIRKIIIFTISIIYSLYLISIAAAHFCYIKSKSVKKEKISVDDALEYIEKAIFFNPLNSQYHYQKYYLLKLKTKGSKKKSEYLKLLNEGIDSLKKSIRLEPTNPSYHMYYAFSLIRKYNFSKDSSLVKNIHQEVKRAAELKPFSKLYQRIYEKYASKVH
jgi:tetratricopeptide (TPR) repeat protein